MNEIVYLVRYTVEVWIPPEKRGPNVGEWSTIRTSGSLENCLAYLVSCDGERYRITMNPKPLQLEVVK